MSILDDVKFLCCIPSQTISLHRIQKCKMWPVIFFVYLNFFFCQILLLTMQTEIKGGIITTEFRWTSEPCPPPKIFSISCSFLENLAKSYVGVPSPPEGGRALWGIQGPPLVSERNAHFISQILWRYLASSVCPYWMFYWHVSSSLELFWSYPEIAF